MRRIGFAFLVFFLIQVQSVFGAWGKDVRIISFSGFKWRVKNSDTRVAPRNNLFSDSQENVRVDDAGRLHLKLCKLEDKWLASELISLKSFGYGTYIFQINSRVDRLDRNTVLGLFTYDSEAAAPNREIDIEFSRWGKDGAINAQYVVQPYHEDGSVRRFAFELNGSFSTHAFTWNRDHVFFQSLNGHYLQPPTEKHVISLWNYTGKNVPRRGKEKVRMNLYLVDESGPSDGKEIEIVIEKFIFVPEAKSFLPNFLSR